jgi:hypothetical protein
MLRFLTSKSLKLHVILMNNAALFFFLLHALNNVADFRFAWQNMIRLSTKTNYEKDALKVLLHEIFWFKVVGQTNPSGLLMNVLKYLLFWFQIRQDIQLFIQSAYSQYTNRLFPRILGIQTVSVRLFSVYPQIHSAYSANTRIEIPFEDLSQSAYSPYT